MKTNTYLRVFLLFTVLAIGWRGATLWPHETVATDIQTKPIGAEQSVGGAPKDTEPTKTKESEQQPTTTAPPKLSKAQRAPKQIAIQQTIHKEYEYRALLTSNDPLTSSSWALNAVNAPTAWDSTTGNGTVVAVIDSGFGLAHEDLTTRWHENSGETGTTQLGDVCWTGSSVSKTSNNCDDDQNGYVDDWRGWNFIYTDNNPQAGRQNPNGAGVSHGTEVAGIVGAAGNNSTGIATISWNNTVMPLQVLSDSGVGYTSDVVAAIYYAVDNGASVINMSLGGDGVDPSMRTALAYAYDNNVVVVAAAGNCGTGAEYGCDPASPGTMSYPATEPSVISVGATDSSDTRASFSSYGSGLDVVAPGSGSIRSPLWTASNPTSAYAGSLYGTSFASPFVASLAGLIKSIRPATSVDDITALIDASARQPAGMSGKWYTTQYGHGIIDAAAAISVASTLESTPASTNPILFQTGTNKTEHRYSSSTSLSSGCKLAEQTYCNVYAVDANTGDPRYLPYQLADASTLGSGWQYTASKLSLGGAWRFYAQSGEKESSSGYWMIQK